MVTHRAPIILAAAQNNVPAVYNLSIYARDGGLLSYGPDFAILRPTVVIVCMNLAPPNHECPNSTHIDGACRAGGGAVHSIRFGLMRCSKGPLGSISKPAASLAVAVPAHPDPPSLRGAHEGGRTILVGAEGPALRVPDQ
jgi:hypothetical protein